MRPLPLLVSQALGIDDSHTQQLDNSKIRAHHAVLPAFKQLQIKAKEYGIAIQIVSGYRSFQRQLAIWNAKTNGDLPVYDDNGRQVDIKKMAIAEVVQAICRFSAVPGLSRHHYGTDFDVVDANVHNPNIQLTTVEAEQYYFKLHRFFDDYAEQFGFFRPYQKDLGAVAIEPWHISYQLIAKQYNQLVNAAIFTENIVKYPVANKDYLVQNAKQIVNHFKTITPM